ncbi:acyl-CoA dehydrogenase family protein [Planococcus sp. N028]|uniref:Acyl-CoA dehydrogenase family protein n=1 Tax=Planococcus shixiaomingii TaxID=3058393 RepID=A0ABT8N5Q2_9BACL|nr:MULTISPECIES: acyl-CoA dehydrogenase family protein [unclassified Planococcus (in: firmicutes)]MDN7243204.1 acyl-CoA dehydrogenase family protein [Planococcus sp. N028]WKA55147.1 acyl-CoA dehydrogenase family protein [Planococcus sp. N022]
MENKALTYNGAGFLYSSSQPESIFTPEDFTEEHRLIAKTAKRFLDSEIRPNNEAIEQQDFALVKKLLGKAGDLGLLGHSIPESYGGLGLDKISKGLVGELLGSAGSYSVAQSNHTCIATLPITYFGTAAQKEKYLPKLTSGEWIGAYCLTEPEAGSDALSARTTAKLNEAGTHYILNGTKMFITNAAFSDTFIVYAKVDGTAFTAFIAEKDHPGLSLGVEEQKMGIKGSSTRTVSFEDCEVPVENLLGEIGKGHVIALNVLNLGRFNLGSACMGAAKYGLELALKYTKERRQFGKAIADFTATQEKIADMALRIYASESLQYRTAGYLEDALGDLYESEDYGVIAKRMMEYATECAVCKVYGSETLDLIADEALQLHGGYGFIKEYKVEQIYRDSRINRIFEGTNEVNRLLIPGNLLKQAAKGVIPFERLVGQAMVEMRLPKVEAIGLISREIEAVHAIRRVFLLAAGVASEIHGSKIVEEQETLMKLADIGVALFAVESAVLRTAKTLERNGEKKEALKVELTKALVDDALLEVEMTARKLIQGIASGKQMHDAVLSVTKELCRLQREGGIQTKRHIAKQLLDAEQYIN